VYSNSGTRKIRRSITTSPSYGKVALNLRSGTWLILGAIVASLLIASIACDSEPRKTDAELGLTPQQAMGRRIYDVRCAECHYAYSSRNLRGPSMYGLFQKKFMTSGIPVNDDRVSEIIMLGRAKMPGFQQKLTQEQLADLMAYLRTL
jgi:mono/diheme cytochrome c family protein